MRRPQKMLAMLAIATIGLTTATRLLVAADDAAPNPPLTASAGQSFQIESAAHPGRLVRPEDANSRDGTPIVLYPRERWKCMTWKFTADATATDGKAFRLVNHFTHKTLAADPAGKGDAVPVIERPAKDDAPQWTFTKLDDGLYRIEQAGKALTAGDDGNLTVSPWTGGEAQKWRLLPKPEKFTG